MSLYELSLQERQQRFERAEAWRGPLSVAEFMARNERLYRHRFGAGAIRCWGWKGAGGALVSSMESIRISFWVRERNGRLGVRSGGLIASVVTPPEFRGKGYASEMLTAFFERFPDEIFVLYSDIGPPFYERFGFAAFPVQSREQPSEAGDLSKASPLAFDAFLSSLGAERLALQKKERGVSVSVSPEADFFDWQVERYRYYLELVGAAAPESFFWLVEGVPLALLPDPKGNRLDVLWHRPGHDASLALAQAKGHEWGLARVRWWAPSGEGKTEWPMLRAPGLEETRYTDVQLCDWW